MKHLGFIKVNDHTSQILIDPKQKATLIYSSFNSLTDLVMEIFKNHYIMDEEGYVKALRYGDTLLNVSPISGEGGLVAEDLTNNYPVLMALVKALIDSKTSPAFIMKFICDISNLKQMNVYDSPLRSLMVHYMKEFKFQLYNVREVALNEMVVSRLSKQRHVDTHFKYQWVFSV